MAKDFSLPEITKRELEQAEPFRLNQVLKLLAEQLTRTQGFQGAFTFGSDGITIPKLTITVQLTIVGGAKISSGTGVPNGQITGNVGDIFLRTDGAAGTVLWVKESQNGGNLGWASK